MIDRKQAIRDREAGMTVSQIAEKYGISKQRASQITSIMRTDMFKPFTEKRCVYPNLRNWINEHEYGLGQMVYMMHLSPECGTVEKLRRILRGETLPKKDWIDAMMEMTGMSYERMFSEKAWGGKNGK